MPSYISALRALLQRLHGDHQNPRHVARVDCGLRADLSDPVVAEKRKEILRHGTIVAKLFEIVANEVLARELKAANLSQHLFSIHRLEVFFLRFVRTGSKHHLPYYNRDCCVSQGGSYCCY